MVLGGMTCLISSIMWLYVFAAQRRDVVCSMGGSDCSIVYPFLISTARLLLPCVILSAVAAAVIGRRRGVGWALAAAVAGSAAITNAFYLYWYL